MTKRQKTGLIVLLSPFIIWFTIFVLQLFGRIIFSDGGVIVRAINVISALGGLVAMLGFLPAIIVGIILLATPGKN